MFVLCSLCAPSPFAAIVAMTTGCMLSSAEGCGGERDRDVNEPARPETGVSHVHKFIWRCHCRCRCLCVVVAVSESFSFAFVALSLRSSRWLFLARSSRSRFNGISQLVFKWSRTAENSSLSLLSLFHHVSVTIYSTAAIVYCLN